MKVLASILSYNSHATLPRVIEGVESQTRQPDRVLVVDNGSDDLTLEYLRTLPDRYELHLLPENLGVGAGHNLALRELLGSDEFDCAWLLENDSIPPPSCLARLLESVSKLENAGVRFGCVKPQQTHPEQQRAHKPPGLQVAATTTFNGILLPRRTIETVGLIREDFFIDQDDREYSQRLVAAGLPVYVDQTITIDHLGKGRGRSSSPTVARTYYRVRNVTYMRRQSMPLALAIMETLVRSGVAVVRTLLGEDLKRRRILARVNAAFDGIRGDLGRKDYTFFKS